MAHWFHLRPHDLEHLTGAELNRFLRALDGLPPIGAQYLILREG